ncbi:hypothetical protein AVEN_225212-1 [Araneus ventricosus]|uniref:Uncharacterized protein n=1 Tax=Araneus ventricosus TaxID=182803 RepID=A0A4Y2AL74_ARAVE|nr:hypothetical protein AVEN_225212-1 [Araneus ventricosus]
MCGTVFENIFPPETIVADLTEQVEIVDSRPAKVDPILVWIFFAGKLSTYIECMHCFVLGFINEACTKVSEKHFHHISQCANQRKKKNKSFEIRMYFFRSLPENDSARNLRFG